MNKKIVGLVLFAVFLIFAKNVDALDATTSAQTSTPIAQVQGKRVDSRAKILTEYLKSYNSPLEDFAQDFIDAADQNGLDWKLIPSISGVESTFGRFIPGGYNGWGWGVYGDQAIYFKSWKDAIFTIARGLKENYIDKGYKDPYSMNKIYASSPTWGSRVAYFINDLDQYAKTYDSQNPSLVKVETNPQVAAISGQLANN